MRILAVDWSGDARAPQRRIRVAEAEPGRDGSGSHGAGRHGSHSHLVAVRGGLDRAGVVDHVLEQAAQGPLVVGFDFSFALPAWFAREHGCDDVEALWALVASRGEEWLRACPPPFWGRPGTRRPAPDPARPLWRDTEAASGHHPLSTFQIGGAGAVGTGSLRGMPHLARLRAAGVAVWPFDAAGHATAVEIYPREMTGAVVKSDPEARTAYAAGDPRVPEALRGDVTATEDAFDAAFSALVMAEHADELATLEARPQDGIEGRIWRPSCR